jgi:glycerol-3-phosphate O-acyltransferase
MDLFAVLKQPVEDFHIPPDIMVQLVDQIRYLLTELNAQGRIKLSYEFDQPTEELIKMGINKLGVFHRFRPLKYNKEGNIVSEDFHLLLYYHNKLIHYDLENQIHWNTIGTANSLNKKFSV